MSGVTLAPLLSTYAPPAGHWDELRDDTGALRPSWARFADSVGDLGAETLTGAAERVARQIHENGVTYNVYAATSGTARPWSLDVLPAIIERAAWDRVERGLIQYARLVDAMAADIYGPQRLIADGVIPSRLVFTRPGFLRACHGVRPPGGTFLHVVAFDLAHAPDDTWRLVGIRAQAPSGLGYVLENRATIARAFPDAARALGTQPLAPFCDRLREVLAATAPEDDGPPHVVLLTPGPFNEAYFDHVYLARELGLPLVQGGDLIVRHGRVFLKTVSGLRRVHGIWRRQDDDYCDPLELRADSTLGVPGLVQAWRLGHVLVANSFGLGVLESPAMLPRLGAACERLLGEPLTDDVPCVTSTELALSHGPVWHDGSMESRAMMLRAFLVSDGAGGYRVLPGGLSRIAGDDRQVVSNQRGGLSKDTWVVGSTPIDAAVTVDADVERPETMPRDRVTSSRAAEHLFWLGRYAERSENNARLIRAVLNRLPEARSRSAAFRACVLHTCQSQGLINDDEVPGRPSDITDRVMPQIERALLDGLSDREDHVSLAFNVAETWRVAGTVRERLSSDNWRVLNRLYQRVSDRASQPVSLDDAFEFLDDIIVLLVAVGGLETAHMTRDDGWRFLSMGRHVERLSFVGSTIGSITLHRAMHEPLVLEWLLDLSDSIMTYRSRHVRQPEWGSVMDLLLFDERNPRAGMFQVARIEKLVPQLPGPEPLDVLSEVEELHGAARVTADSQLSLFGSVSALDYLPRACARLAARVSDAVTLRYFSHAFDQPHAT
jgi:uncharacterized circularly permuted ATP-grasp superfamily protein/uncharacterized alpha-E superfamily protein